MAYLMDEGLGEGLPMPTDENEFSEEMGGEVPQLGEEPPIDSMQPNFYENLAFFMDEAELSSLANKLLDDVEEDLASRKEWDTSTAKVMKYLGLKIEEYRQVPFLYASAAFDTTLSTALYKSYATIRAELFPENGPCVGEVFGQKTDERVNQAALVEAFMNHYLTSIDEVYYADSEQLIIYTTCFGTCFRKTYQDPITKMPISRYVAPQDLIIDNNTTTILESARITHVIDESKKDIKLKQEMGIYRDIPLDEINEEEDNSEIDKNIKKIEGITTSAQENKTQCKIYEVSVELLLKIDDDVRPENQLVPYLVTIDTSTRKILSLVRNWREGDDKFKRKNLYTCYKYLPGFGLYGVGLFSLCGSNAIALTSIERQQIDAGSLKNFPGGLRKKGMKIERNDKAVGPSEFLEIETGGDPIGDAVMLMPYAEPSTVLAELRKQLKDETFMLAGIGDLPISENRADAPVGTTLALIEVATRLQSSVMRSMHMSLNSELKKLFDLMAECLPDEPYPFDLPGKEAAIVKSYFNKNIGILPVSNPRLTTSTQRILDAEARLKLASSNPQIHNIYEAYNYMYKTMGLSPEDIKKILPTPQETPPLDPVSENALMMQGKPVKAAPYQDHQAHIMTHQMLLQNPATQAAAQAHIQEHTAQDYLNQMQVEMQMELPPLEQIAQNPELQNHIAVKAAEITKQKMEAQAAEQQKQQPPDPSTVMMMDIEQRREAAHLKHQEAELRAETEAFKTQTNFETEKMKIENQRDMAEEGNEVKLEIENLKLSKPKGAK